MSRGQKRSADHGHRVDPSAQGHVRQQHMGFAARRTQRPTGAKLNRARLAPNHPPPSKTPTLQPSATSRAANHPGRQISLDLGRVVLYHKHGCLRHLREDPLVLDQEICEGVLARSGHPQAVVTQTTLQAQQTATTSQPSMSPNRPRVLSQRVAQHSARRTLSSRQRDHSVCFPPADFPTTPHNVSKTPKLMSSMPRVSMALREKSHVANTRQVVEGRPAPHPIDSTESAPDPTAC